MIASRCHARLPALAMAGATAGLALALSACSGALQPRSHLADPDTRAAAATLGALALAPAAWPAQDWWTRYGDPQLDTLVARALAGHPSLRVAEARLRLASAGIDSSAAALLPSVGLGASATRQHYTANGLVPKPVAGNWAWSNQAALTLSYDVDFWGRNRAALDAAVGRSRASEAELFNARLLLCSAVVRAYLQLDEQHAQLALAQRTLERRQAILALTQRRVAAHIDSQVELRQAETAVPVAQGQVVALQAALALLRNGLGALLGEGADAGLAITRPALRGAGATPAGLPTRVPAELIGRRPDVVAQRWQVQAAGRDIAVAKAAFYPDISLTALLGFQSLGFSDFINAGSRSIGVAPALSLPLFEGGRLRANLSARDAAYDIAVEQYNLTTLEAVRDVLAQLIAMRWLDAQRQQSRLAVASADAAFGLASARYRAGLGTYLQVLASELQLLAQQRDDISLTTRALELDVSLNQALGGGFAPDLDAAGAQAPGVATLAKDKLHE